MKLKTWIKTWLTIISIVFISIGTFNYIIDPYWYFNHSNKWNTQQWGFNERQQKCNFIKNNNLDFTSILLGSSRTTVINSEDFNFTNAYNFSASAMMPEEYSDYIDFFKKEQNIKNLDYIILAMDFFGSSILTSTWENPKVYFNNSKFTLGKLLNYEMTNRSIKNIKMSLRNPFKCDYENKFFNRKGQKIMYFQEKRTKMLKRLNANIKYSKKQGYKYNTNYKNILKQLKENHLNSKFIIFTTPVSKPYFDFLLKRNGIQAYSQWLKDLVNEFGIVYHFMDLNSITMDYKHNFADGHHFYPKIGTLIAKNIINFKQKKPDDFGVLLTKDNIDRYINELKNKVNNE